MVRAEIALHDLHVVNVVLKKKVLAFTSSRIASRLAVRFKKEARMSRVLIGSIKRRIPAAASVGAAKVRLSDERSIATSGKMPVEIPARQLTCLQRAPWHKRWRDRRHPELARSMGQACNAALAPRPNRRKAGCGDLHETTLTSRSAAAPSRTGRKEVLDRESPPSQPRRSGSTKVTSVEHHGQVGCEPWASRFLLLAVLERRTLDRSHKPRLAPRRTPRRPPRRRTSFHAEVVPRVLSAGARIPVGLPWFFRRQDDARDASTSGWAGSPK